MKKLIFAGVAVTVLAFVAADSAQAGHRSRCGSGSGFQLSFGSGRVQVGYGRGYSRHYGRSYGRYGSSYRRSGSRSRHGSYHDTSHYDYHPGSYVRHRGHYDYVPGHYDYHRTGHYDH